MKKILAVGIIILFVGTIFAPSIIGDRDNNRRLTDNITKVTSDKASSIDNETEYWALLVAVGVYAGHPEQDRPWMLTHFEDLYNMLLVSEHWNEKNIKVIKGENATLLNIIKGFRWLNKREDKNDFSLVYITTHGGQLSRDRFPWDEKDGCDEILMTHRGFLFPWVNIRDDFLNLLLSLLNSKGVCVVVESCFAGGFNDPPYFKTNMKGNRINANVWVHDFAEELSESGRVVLMSSQEDEVCYGGFTGYLIEGLTGYADTNKDDLVSAEEAFDYAKVRYDEQDVHATIYDDYPGEFQLTEVELPPSIPETPIGQVLGDTNTTYNYSTVSIDPEGGKISYGWDWNGDFTVDEWTDPLDCNTTVNISHSWSVEGTYNLRVKAKDERGVLSDWSAHTVVMMCDDNIPDQRQTVIGGGAHMYAAWFAQSFVPTLSTLSKVELGIESWGHNSPTLIHMYIRENLTGGNLAECSRYVPFSGEDKCNWFTFDFEDLDVIPGDTYYIIFEKTDLSWVYCWRWMYSDPDPYPLGDVFESSNGDNWIIWKDPVDFCFVTWGK